MAVKSESLKRVLTKVRNMQQEEINNKEIITSKEEKGGTLDKQEETIVSNIVKVVENKVQQDIEPKTKGEIVYWWVVSDPKITVEECIERMKKVHPTFTAVRQSYKEVNSVLKFLKIQNKLKEM